MFLFLKSHLSLDAIFDYANTFLLEDFFLKILWLCPIVYFMVSISIIELISPFMSQCALLSDFLLLHPIVHFWVTFSL